MQIEQAVKGTQNQADPEVDGRLAVAIVTHSDDAIMSVAIDGTVTSWNRGAERIFGFRADEMIGRSVLRLYPHERRHEAQELKARVQAGEDVSQFETRRLRKDGTEVEISLTLSALRDREGRIVAVSKIARDITERMRMQARVAELTADMSRILEHAPAEISVWNADRTNRYANSAYAAKYGMTPETMRGRRVEDILGAEAFAELRERFDAALTGTACRFERDVPQPDGSVRHELVDYVPDERGGVRRVLFAFVHDITPRKRAENELTLVRERLALALESSELSVWDFDVPSGVVTLDERWARIMELAPGVTRTSAAELAHMTHPEDVERAVQAAVYAYKGAAPGYVVESRLQTGSGQWKWIRCSGKVVARGPDGRALRAIGTNLDVTARRAADEQIRVMAFFDGLTGLPNRALFHDRLQQAVASAHRGKRPMCVLYLDLDRFKEINDERGHATGDLVLRDVARRFQRILRESDTLARLGGDEFGIVAPNTDSAEAAVIARRIRGVLEAPLSVGGEPISLGVSVGISSYPEDGTTPDQLLRRSDIAMYRAKVARRAEGS